MKLLNIDQTVRNAENLRTLASTVKLTPPGSNNSLTGCPPRVKNGDR